MQNQKIKNARNREYDNIVFKSNLELACYKRLKQANFNFEYEHYRFTLLEGWKCGIRNYAPNKVSGKTTKDMFEQTQKIRSITYTPDFSIVKSDYTIYVDTKGFSNDVYPYKKKMFLKKLEEISDKTGEKFIFFEPHNVRQINQMIEIINNL